MSRGTLWKLLHHPWSTLTRGLHKALIGPLKYGRAGGYDARRYWGDRFRRYGTSLRGAGDEGLSDADNQRIYRHGAEVFLDQCRRLNLDLRTASIAEIGVGTGFWLDLLHDAGATRYVGLDITDVLFEQLRARRPAIELRRQDITAQPIEGTFDLIIMMDVVEHIVERSRLDAAMAHVRVALAPGGVFMVSGLQQHSARHRFYTHAWTAADIAASFAGLELHGPVPFRDNLLLVVRRP